MTTKRATRKPDVAIRRASDGVEISADHATVAPKHTPGPWRVWEWKVPAERRLTIKAEIGDAVVATIRNASNPIHDADAALVAAAPKLYAASLHTIEILDNLIADLERIAGASVITGLVKLKRQHMEAIAEVEGSTQP